MTGRVFLFLFLIQGIWVQAQNYELSLDRDRIFMGQSTMLELVWTGNQAISPPDIPDTPGLNFRFSGQSAQSFFSFGNQSESSHQLNITYRWEVIPSEVGNWEIPSFEIRSADGSWQTDPLNLQVEEPWEFEDFVLQISSDQAMLFPGQQAEIKLVFYFTGRVHNLKMVLPFLEENPELFTSVIPSALQSDIYRTVLYGREHFGELGAEYLDGQQYTSLTFTFLFTPRESGDILWDGIHCIYDLEELKGDFRLLKYTTRSNSLGIEIPSFPNEILGNVQGVLISEGPLGVETRIEPHSLRIGDPCVLILRYTNLLDSPIVRHRDPSEYLDTGHGLSFSEEEGEIQRIDENTWEIRKKLRLVDLGDPTIASMPLYYFDLEEKRVMEVEFPETSYEILGEIRENTTIEELGIPMENPREDPAFRRLPETLAVHYPWHELVIPYHSRSIGLWLVILVFLLGPVVILSFYLKERLVKRRGSPITKYPWQDPHADPIVAFTEWAEKQDTPNRDALGEQILRWEKALYIQGVDRKALEEEMDGYAQKMD